MKTTGIGCGIFAALISFLLLFSPDALGASTSDSMASNTAGEKEKVDMDPALYSYMKQCRRFSDSPRVLVMLDTLYERAEKLGDERTMAVALCEKALHWYNKPETPATVDSLKKYVKETQAFALKTNQPRYYYWIWMRLAEYYLKNREFNLSLYELRSMLNQATTDNDVDGIVSAYKVMARVYNAKHNYPRAEKMQKKVIDLTSTGEEKDFNLTNSYMRLATFQMAQQKYDSARMSLESADKEARTEKQRATVLGRWVAYYYACKDYDNMKKAYAKLKEMKEADAEALNSSEYFIAVSDKNYPRAVEIVETLRKTGVNSFDEYYLRLAELYAKMPGKERESIENFRKYVAFSDSLSIADSNSAIEQFTSILNLQDMEMEQKNMEISMQEDKNKTLLIVTGMCVITAIILLFLLMKTIRGKKVRIPRNDRPF